MIASEELERSREATRQSVLLPPWLTNSQRILILNIYHNAFITNTTVRSEISCTMQGSRQEVIVTVYRRHRLFHTLILKRAVHYTLHTLHHFIGMSWSAERLETW